MNNFDDINFTGFIERNQLMNLIFNTKAVILTMGNILGFDHESTTYKEIESIANDLSALLNRLENGQIIRDFSKSDLENMMTMFGVNNAGI